MSTDEPTSRAGSTFDPARGYRCSPSVALRPEPFGALVYHFGTRRLSFLKTPQLVAVVSGLADHPDVHSALDAAGVDPAQRPRTCVPWPAWPKRHYRSCSG